MKFLIKLATIATYLIVCYFCINFIIHAIDRIDDFLSFTQVILTSGIIILVTALSGYFCVKIITDKDTE